MLRRYNMPVYYSEYINILQNVASSQTASTQLLGGLGPRGKG